MMASRRQFLKFTGLAGTGLFLESATADHAWGQNPMPVTSFVDTPILKIAYEERGDSQAFPIILLHGFPDDVRAFDGVVAPLTSAGHRVLVPYLRGYGPTRFRSATAPRMAEQAA